MRERFRLAKPISVNSPSFGQYTSRHKEPVPGWHTCELACADAET